jgi:glycosyltransferase involved in cell wall biosynthesis
MGFSGEHALVVPALNEAGSIRHVVEGFSALRHAGAPLIDEIVVVDNNSTDGTGELARAAGASVAFEPVAGYGRACQRGLRYLAERAGGPPGVVSIVEGDGSAEPDDLYAVLAPILASEADFVLGARTRLAEPGSLTQQQRFGNWLACRLIQSLYGARYSDLASVRSITWDSLMRLDMQDMTYGWSIEMQIKAARQGLRVREVDVRTHARLAGVSKVSGSLRGVIGAGWKIIATILRYR